MGFLASLGLKAIDKLIDRKEDKKAANQARDASAQEYQRQKEFAQMGLRWKVDDAKAAGLHPLAAIGAAGASYSPAIALPAQGPRSSLASDLADVMGQNTTRAQVATMTDTEKQLQELAIRRAQLQNASLEWDITAKAASFMGQPKNPSMPASVGPDTVVVKPSEVTSRDSRDPSIAAGTQPGYVRAQISDNVFVDVPNQALAEGFEAMPPGSATASWISRSWDRFWNGYERPKVPGQWQWSPWSQSWHETSPRPRQYRDTARRRVGRPSDLYDHR